LGGVKAEKNEKPASTQIFSIFLNWVLRICNPNTNGHSCPRPHLLLPVIFVKLRLWLYQMGQSLALCYRPENQGRGASIP